MNKKKKIVYILGTRPEIIRSAVVLKKLKHLPNVDLKIVHTGQHYDYQMSEVFFSELDVPAPDINFEVGSSSHSQQTADIMIKSEEYFLREAPDVVAVFGDTNSSLAAALAAVKLNVPLAHIEAGCREWEMNMPEEINRRLIDQCSNLLLAVSELSVKNLQNEKIQGKIVNVGDPLWDVYQKFTNMDDWSLTQGKFGLNVSNFALLTLHRANNVDDPAVLKRIITSFRALGEMPLVFPVHPRTKSKIHNLNLTSSELPNFIMIPPVEYKDMISLVKNANIVLTDSGGLQKEAFWSGARIITLREHTAWQETVELGRNVLVSSNEIKIQHAIKNALRGSHITKKSGIPQNPYAKENSTGLICDELISMAGYRW